VLARADTRHNGAVLEVHHRFPVGTAFAAPQKALSSPFRSAVAELEKSAVLRHDATNGRAIGPYVVLHPAATDRFKRGQEQAVVLLGSFEGVKVLLLSGLGAAGQNVLFNRLKPGGADIVVTEMPDYGEPLAPELIERFNPRLIVFVDTPRAPYPERLRQRLARTGVPILFTRDTGAITLRMHKGSWTVETALTPPVSPGPGKPQSEPDT
jgi:beta-lactamase superfamily II metal-dependent hydrolase